MSTGAGAPRGRRPWEALAGALSSPCAGGWAATAICTEALFLGLGPGSPGRPAFPPVPQPRPQASDPRAAGRQGGPAPAVSGGLPAESEALAADPPGGSCWPRSAGSLAARCLAWRRHVSCHSSCGRRWSRGPLEPVSVSMGLPATLGTVVGERAPQACSPRHTGASGLGEAPGQRLPGAARAGRGCSGLDFGGGVRRRAGQESRACLSGVCMPDAN